MQDPSGDGKIVYLFLPLYKVRTTVPGCYLLSDGRTARPKDGPVSPASSEISCTGSNGVVLLYFSTIPSVAPSQAALRLALFSGV